MRGGGQRPGAKLHTRPGLNLPQSTPPPPRDTEPHTRERAPRPSHCPTVLYHSAEDLRPRAGRGARNSDSHSWAPQPPRPGPAWTTQINQTQTARPASRAPPRLLCQGPERAPRAATPFSRRDDAARRNWAAGQGAAPTSPGSKCRPGPHGSRPPSLHRATYRGRRDPAAISRAATELERRRPARLPA